jgi:hypothetical protein
MKFLLKGLVASFLLLFACNSNQSSGQEESNNDSTVQTGINNVQDTLVSGCYSLINGRDTASLVIEKKGTIVSGSLSYNLFEKDRNDGTFTGEITGNRINVWYMFRSEGIMSVRQEAWQINNGQLWPATGEVTVRNDTARFADPSTLKFDKGRAFVKVPCTI